MNRALLPLAFHPLHLRRTRRWTTLRKGIENVFLAPRRMSAKTADRHTVCISCRGFDCSIESRCEECIEWLEEEVCLYAKLRKSLKSKGSSKHRSKPSASPPSADSVPSSQPSALANMQTQVDSLNSLVNSLAESLLSRMDALQASLVDSSVPQSSSPTRLGKDAVPPQPGQTAGESRMFQALCVGSRTSGGDAQLIDQGGSAPRQELLAPSAAPQPYVAPGAAAQPSAAFYRQLPAAPAVWLSHSLPPQPSTVRGSDPQCLLTIPGPPKGWR